MKIIFDLDGTLLCAKKRLYELFLDLLENEHISYDSYWNLKFSGSKNVDILRNCFGYVDAKIDIFLINWMNKIESDYYLDMDVIIAGAEKTLEKYCEGNELYVCTARQSVSQVQKQLRNLGVFDFFQEVFVTEHKVSKEEVIKRSGIVFSKEDWMVGDTGYDINTGKRIGTNTCAVLSGFMSERSLGDYSPDLMIENVTYLDI